ncbi:MAG TPA: hypothetical protein VM076_22500 [Gemmatimonadaceae bacterium]|nr:hypothetical protein [Gemmatimonadaceae bacterium]
MTDDGRGELKAYLAPIHPPAELRDRVRANWGQTRISSSRRTAGLSIAAVGLIAAGFLLGALVRPRSRAADRPVTAAGRYVVLLYGDAPDDTGAVHVAREREYGRWATALGGGVRWVGGSELHDVVAQLGPSLPGSDPPTGRLAGYFVIEAPSRERATEVAESCPHLKYGGRVVVMTVAS